MEKLRVCTLFSGYDSQCMALDRIGIDYDLVAWAEIDRYAIEALIQPCKMLGVENYLTTTR